MMFLKPFSYPQTQGVPPLVALSAQAAIRAAQGAAKLLAPGGVIKTAMQPAAPMELTVQGAVAWTANKTVITMIVTTTAYLQPARVVARVVIAVRVSVLLGVLSPHVEISAHLVPHVPVNVIMPLVGVIVQDVQDVQDRAR